MSEERPTRRSFFNRMFSPEEEGEDTMVFSPENAGLVQEPEEPMEKPQGLTVERAAEVIRSIPDEVPYGSAVPIVRLTLEAAGISMGELGTSTRARESKLNSVIEQRQGRIKKLGDDTDKAVRYKEQEIKALEEDIKKFRQARDNGVAQEEEKISQARVGLEEVDLVRSFFDLSAEEESPAVEKAEPVEELPPAGAPPETPPTKTRHPPKACRRKIPETPPGTRPRSWAARSRRSRIWTRRRCCAVPGRSLRTGKPGGAASSEHPAPVGPSRPGVRAEPSGRRPAARDTEGRPGARRDPAGLFRGGFRGRLARRRRRVAYGGRRTASRGAARPGGKRHRGKRA